MRGALRGAWTGVVFVFRGFINNLPYKYHSFGGCPRPYVGAPCDSGNGYVLHIWEAGRKGGRALCLKSMML